MNALTNPFVTASAKGAAWMLVWSWQAAVLLACVWAGLKIFRVKSPALRHQVWLFALIAVVAIPVLSGVVQYLPLPQPSNKALSYAVEFPRIIITNDAPVVQNPSPAVSVKPSIKRPIILSLSFALWLAGVCVIVTRAAINSAKLRRLRAGARLTSLADLDCAECDCEALRDGKVSVALSDETCSPILLGVLRPMIVLPADIASWTSPMERCAMLRHELAHVARRDHYVNLFQTILGAVFFFHPLARYACRQLTVEREMACDDHVVGSGAEAEAYAESIIKVAERSIALAGAPSGVHQLALFSTRQILERRIEWKYLILPVALIAVVAWLLIPGRLTKSGLAQPQSGDTSLKLQLVKYNEDESVFALLRQMADASIRRDTSFFERVLDEDYRETGPNGETLNKAQAIADVKRLDYQIKKFEFDDLSVSGSKHSGREHSGREHSGREHSGSEHMAFATFLGTAYFETNGQESTLQFRYTVNFINRDGQLKVAAIHMSLKQ